MTRQDNEVRDAVACGHDGHLSGLDPWVGGWARFFELVDQSGDPYEEEVLGRYVYRARALRALAELGPRKSKRTLPNGEPVYVIREAWINNETA